MAYYNPLIFVSGDKNSSLWEELKKKSSFFSKPKRYDWGYNTLKSGLSKFVKTIIIEPHYICKDFRDLFSNYYSKKFIVGSSYCERLHFFSQDLDELDFLIDPSSCQDSYLGYSVIRPVPGRCLGRTIINPYLIDDKKKVLLPVD